MRRLASQNKKVALNKQKGELKWNIKEWKVREGNKREENDSSYFAKKNRKGYSPVTSSNITHCAKRFGLYISLQ
jgi:hypothetical protein